MRNKGPGRPTIRRNGIALTAAERAKRYRHNKRKRTPKNCEWYSPPWFIELVRKVMTIDLDPASNEIANEIVKAQKFYAIDDDGLKQKWHGNIFLNPPYSRGVINKFVNKLLDEVLAGNVKQAILLTHSKTDTRWFVKAAKHATAACFPKRIAFWSSSIKKGADWARNPSTTFYFGNRPERFREVFKECGILFNAP